MARRWRLLAAATILSIGWCLSSAAAAVWSVDAEPAAAEGADLQAVIDRAASGDTILIGPGVFRAKPVPFLEDLCGNCQDHRTQVEASVGFLVAGKALTIVGAGAERTVLETSAGYGVLFLDSWDSVLRGVKVTGGVRDKDGNATDAAVVARQSRVTITECVLADNEYRDSSVVVGVGGVFGREGAELYILHNRIENNGWDGVALYRGAVATIADNVIRTGRGAGVGVTWDATATVLRNDVSGYWKGIGSFGNTRVVARNNRVHHNLGWGIIATGSSFMDATNNAVVRNGNCGMALWGDSIQGRFANNVVYKNGWRKQWVCPCVGVWDAGQPKGFAVSNNLVFANEAGDFKAVEFDLDKPGPSYDLTGSFGNLSQDPLLADTVLYRPLPNSPLFDAGDTLLSDPDGSRSDIGVYGGPAARPQE
jgi:hypothetical protein